MSMNQQTFDSQQSLEESKAQYEILKATFDEFKAQSANSQNSSDMAVEHVKNLFLKGTCTSEPSIRKQVLTVLIKALGLTEDEITSFKQAQIEQDTDYWFPKAK